MSIGKKDIEKQIPMWIPQSKATKSPGHPFYVKLNKILKKDSFDPWIEALCAPFFKKGGRPSLPPGVYFRMLMIGYFEGLTSERGIAWRCADSLSLREFLGYELHESTPDHSSFTIWRQRLSLEIYEAVFARILCIVDTHGLLGGETIGVDSTSVEANAAMKSIVRKDTKESYPQYLDRLIEEAGGEKPTCEERVRFDKKRKGKKVSNKDWESTTDPDARVTRMKNGSTHMAYKAENAVDLDSSIVVAARITSADQGDTKTLLPTLENAQENLERVSSEKHIIETVADKGYHKAELIKELNWERGIVSYIPERKQGRRRWHGDDRACQEFHANRQRCKRDYGKNLGRKRTNLVERTFAHLCVTGGLSRFTVRGLENAHKRYLAHAVAYNLGVLMRALHGCGTPRGAADRRVLMLFALYLALILAHLIDFDQ